jgi:hypothetical protein
MVSQACLGKMMDEQNIVCIKQSTSFLREDHVLSRLTVCASVHSELAELGRDTHHNVSPLCLAVDDLRYYSDTDARPILGDTRQSGDTADELSRELTNHILLGLASMYWEPRSVRQFLFQIHPFPVLRDHSTLVFRTLPAFSERLSVVGALPHMLTCTCSPYRICGNLLKI